MLGDYLYGYLGALAGLFGFLAARAFGFVRSARETRSRVAADSLARAVRNGEPFAVRHGLTDSGSNGHGNDDGDSGSGSLVRETGRRAIRRNHYRFGAAPDGRRSAANFADAAALT